MSEWILLEDEMPDQCGQEVLLTIENMYNQRRVIIGFTGYMEDGKLSFHTNEKTVNLEKWEVVAWKPVPAAYEDKEVPALRSRDDLIQNLQEANVRLMVINQDIKYPDLEKQHKDWLWAAQEVTHRVLTHFMKQDLERIIGEMTEEEKVERGIVK